MAGTTPARSVKWVLVLPGADPADAQAEAEGARVVAVDGGADRTAEASLRPHLIVGDMDSVEPATLDAYERDGVEVLRHPPRKDHVDAQLALDVVLDRGAREIVFLGAAGGRWDHGFALLQLVHRALARDARVRAVEADGRLWGVTPALPLRLELPPRTLLSVLPLSERAEGVTLRGFEYPLKDAVMEFGNPYGVSNVTLETPQHLSCTSGILVVIQPFSRPRPGPGP